MKLYVYALRDRLADNFRSITMNESDELERRNLSFAVNNDSQFNFMAKDMELCRIGEIDNKTGVISPITPIQVVVRCDQLINVEREVLHEV